MSDKKYHHSNLKKALIETGIELINSSGAQNLSLRKIAAQCGVSQTAPYSYFKSKEELLTAMQNYVTEQFMSALQNTVDSFPKQNDPHVLIALGKAYVMFFIKNPQYYTFLFSKEGMTVDLALDADGTKNFPPYELLKKTVFDVFESSGLSDEKLQDNIILLWSTVHGLSAIAGMKNVYYDKNWESKIEDIIWNKNN
ncbi:putative TetR family transcriptional regulator [Oscillibacter valericigenes Sjm18-20]|nr:putative TetR family transcriptional regulator [Oscillibacter valericigenes Sjm18-20]